MTYSGNKRFDKLIVFFAAYSIMTPAKIERIVQQLRLSVPTSSKIGSVVEG